MLRRLACSVLAAAAATLAGCHAVKVPGYETWLHDAWPHRGIGEYYLKLDPIEDGSGVRPLRDAAALSALWSAAAQRACTQRSVKVTFGPNVGKVLPEFCNPFPGEGDCAPSISGYFICEGGR